MMPTGQKRHLRGAMAVIILAVAGLAASGCSTTSLEDAAPRPVAQQSLAPQTLMPSPSSPGQSAATAAAATPEPVAGAPAATAAKTDTQTYGPSDSAPVDTGTYPNINNVPKGETAQMTPAERAAMIQELAAARQGTAVGAKAQPGNSSPDAMKKIGATHAKDALAEIEAQ